MRSDEPRSFTMSVVDLLRELRAGQLVLPSEEWRWDQDDIIAFFDSLRRNFPIGMLLLWQGQAGGVQTVYDGQQRLLTLVRVLWGPLVTGPADDEPRAHVACDLRNGRFFHLDPHAEVKPWHLPLRVTGKMSLFIPWMREMSLRVDPQEAERLVDEADRVSKIWAYGVPVCLVPGEAAAREILDRHRAAEKRELSRSRHA